MSAVVGTGNLGRSPGNTAGADPDAKHNHYVELFYRRIVRRLNWQTQPEDDPHSFATEGATISLLLPSLSDVCISLLNQGSSCP